MIGEENKMVVKHSGLVCKDEKNADKFYRDLLGLTKSEPKILQKDLSQKIFDIHSELKMINYTSDDVHFEIFIYNQEKNKTGIIEHICLEMDEREKFLSKCESMGIKVNKIQKEQKTLIFIWDFDYHLYEIKGR